MKKAIIIIFSTAIVVFIVVFSVINMHRPGGAVAVYTSVDQVYAEPVFKYFEQKTGIRVLPVYDVEASKTTGLVNRLIAEKKSPRADVFWNGEFAQTILLNAEGTLAPYKSPNASGIPAKYKDAKGFWTGFGGRARVLLVNKNMLSPSGYPKSIFDLLKPEYAADKIGIAYPVFGTAATQAAAIYADMGREKARDFFNRLYRRGIRVADGNSVVRDLVVSGQLAMGLTDTDDASAAVAKGEPVKMIFLDQDVNGMGTLIIPNTVAMISGAAHPGEAKKLIDFLLSREVEEMLVESGWTNISVRPGGSVSEYIGNPDIKGMNVNLEDVYANMNASNSDMKEIFIR